MRNPTRIPLLGFLFILRLLFTINCADSAKTEWVKVTKGTLHLQVDISGVLQSTEFNSYGPPSIPNLWNFTLTQLVEDGKSVEKGDTLMSFDAKKIRDNLNAAINQKDRTVVNIEKQLLEIRLAKQNDALRFVELEAIVRKASMRAEQSKELTGRLELQLAKLDLEIAHENVTHAKGSTLSKTANSNASLANSKATLHRLQENVQQYQRDIESMKIKATKNGTAFRRTAWGGDKPKVGDRIWRMGTAIEVASLDSMMAKGTVDEADIAKTKKGQIVRIRLESHPDNEISGRIDKIASSVGLKSPEEPINVIQVEFSIDSTAGLPLRPGMRFRGKIETESVKNALILPPNAVFPSKEGPVVFLQTPNGIAMTAVTLGKQGKHGVQILDGLQEGDKVSRLDLRPQSLRKSKP